LTEAEMCLRVDLGRALGQLTDKERQAVVLIGVFGLTVREAAAVIGTSRMGCHRAFSRAADQLREALRVHRGGRR
jgi:DNA-directed RNA polymerase specialized sigma24 family protein